MKNCLRSFVGRRVSVIWLSCSIGLLLPLQACRAPQVHILPPRYTFDVAESQIPAGIRKTFHEQVQGADIQHTSIYVAGDKLVFYIFNFQRGGKLQEAHITPFGELTTIFDVPDRD